MAILIVDDDATIRALLERTLRESGDDWDVRHAASGKEALALASEPTVECVLLDYRMPGADGLSVLRELRRLRPELPVVMVTGSGSESVAVEAMQLGAANYVVKESTYAYIVPGLVREALGKSALERLRSDAAAHAGTSRQLPPLDPAVRKRFEADGFVVRSPAMLQVLASIERAAQTTAPVLIEGESGTGKELCARALHTHGPRAAGPYVRQNSAAIPETLVESELFGHARGAFTGADRNRTGLFDQAHGGTLFLDEIGESTATLQAKLLRAIEDGEIRPLGATSPHRVDVRVVAATNRDLREETGAGQFRRDLYYRLRVFPIVVPPLRQRREDVMPLARHFLTQLSEHYGKPLGGFHPETVTLLERYAWPGNVRELRHEIERVVIAAAPDEEVLPDAVAPEILAHAIRAPDADASLREIMRQIETTVVSSRLREKGFRRAETAKSLGMTPEGLWHKMRALGLARPPRK